MLINEYMAREQAGFDVQLLTSNDLKTAYGLKARSGILSEKGASCNAYLLTHELLQYCMQKGVQVYDHTNIKKIRSYREKIVLETEQGFYIESDYLVNASGYEVVDFIKKKIVNLDCTYAVVSEPMADRTQIWQNDIMMWNTDNPYLYLCPTSERRIILGGRDEPFVNMKTMYRYVDKKAALLAKDFRKRFPYIPFTKELAWSGVFGKTRDSLPYIGNYPAGSRIFYALGFGGNGITFSQVAGEIIADLISGKPNRDAALFSFTR